MSDWHKARLVFCRDADGVLGGELHVEGLRMDVRGWTRTETGVEFETLLDPEFDALVARLCARVRG